jgi:hypothetical protein
VPVLGTDLAEALLDDHAGVVDQIVQPPVLLENLGDERLARSWLPDIGLMQCHRGPAPRSVIAERLCGGDVAGVHRGHRDTGPSQPIGDGAADSPGSARDERDSGAGAH